MGIFGISMGGLILVMGTVSYLATTPSIAGVCVMLAGTAADSRGSRGLACWLGGDVPGLVMHGWGCAGWLVLLPAPLIPAPLLTVSPNS